MATHPSVLAWRIPGTGEPGGLSSLGSHRVRHDWSDLAAAPTAASSGVPITLAGWYGPGSYKVIAFLLGAGMHKTLCASSKSGAFLSLSPVEFLGGSSSHCQTSRLGSLIWGSELSLLWENFCGIIIFQFMNFPHGRYGIWFYCVWEPLFPSCCGLFFVFGCRVSFFFF